MRESGIMKYFSLLLVLFVYFCGETSAQKTKDYCETKLCIERTHIACNNNGSFAKICSKDSAIVDIAPFKNLILNRHNKKRNRIAAGNITGYKPAVRMATIVWDPELADLAELNVKTCTYEHDACRNTDRFQHSGQNLAWKWGSTELDPREHIISFIDEWFSEHRNGSMEYIDNYYNAVKPMSRFALMVVEENRRIGCAMVRQTDSQGMGGFECFFACNYASTNKRNLPIYVSGPSASQCTKGPNPNHPALCSLQEPIMVNRW